MMTFLLLSLFMLLSISSVSAQVERSPSKLFHANDIRTLSWPEGKEFSDLSNAVFIVPFEDASSPSTIFSKRLIISGIVPSGQATAVVSDFSHRFPCTFEAGPGQSHQSSPSGNTEDYNKVFSVTGAEILEHIDDFKDGKIDHPSEAIFGWPGNGNSWFENIHGFPLFQSNFGAAPFVETVGNENGIYEPELGEYPTVKNLPQEIFPDQIHWMIYRTKSRQIFNEECLSLEVKQTTYAFNCDELSKTLFQQYEIRNFGIGEIDNFKAGIEVISNLGCFSDDAFGTSLDHQCVYLYNADNIDQDDRCSGHPNYGENPPAFAFGPLKKEMATTMYSTYAAVDPSSPRRTPYTLREFYNKMNAQWVDGTLLTTSGTGYNPNDPNSTLFVFPDNPKNPNGWSMISEGLISNGWFPLFTTGKSKLEVDDPFVMDVAFHYARDEDADHLDNAEQVVQEFGEIRNRFQRAEWPCSAEFCDCSCIWPGDANNNGKVEITDIANIVLSLDESGPVRKKGLAWLPTDTDDWSEEVLSTNTKYSDVNGDGKVNEEDLELWESYFLLENSCHSPTSDYCEEGPDVYFAMKQADTILQPNKGYNGSIILKDVNKFIGYSFDLYFDQSIDRVYCTPTLNWKDDSIRTYERELYNGKYEPSAISVIAMNDRKMNLELTENTDNEIAWFFFSTDELPTTYPTRYVEYKICNFTVYYEDGMTEKLPTQTLKYRLPDEVVITNTKEEEKDVIQIIPNPTDGLIKVMGLKGTSSALLVDLHGKPVREKTMKEGDDMDISALPPGLYFLQIKDGGHLWSKRVVKR